MALPLGSSAPDFELKSKTATGLQSVKLSDNFGKTNTVLLFFPLAFTSVCTTELCNASGGGLSDLPNATVLGISVDSPFAQEVWAKNESITITLLSDLNKEVIKAYDIVFPGLAGVGDTASRAVFVIDKAGKIVHVQVTPTPKDLPDFEAVKAALAQL